jgi:uncharacterized protein (DUF1800 family)
MDDAARVGLLARRAGFGAGPGELQRLRQQGWEATLQELLHPEQVADDLDGLLGRLSGSLLDLQTLEDVQTWWLYRMVQTGRPLLEKLALFWHGHFAVANYKVNNARYMHQHVELLRAHAFGRLDELLLAVSRDPAMLVWLDGATNHRNAPNENYGRELLELYTLGIGNYDEDDVLSAARAFTGWNLVNDQFFFDENQHDSGDKTFLGQTGAFDGADILRILANEPATGYRLASKLFAFFAYPNAEPEVLAPLVDAYQTSGHDLRSLVEAVLRSDALYSERSQFEHIKSPIEYVVGSVRMLGAQVRERDLIPVLRTLGQEILNPPNVAGWPGDGYWINPSTLLMRFNFAARLASARGLPGDSGSLQIVDLLGTADASDAQSRVDRVQAVTGGLQFSAEARQALIAYVQSPLDYPEGFKGQPNPQQRQMATDARLRGLLLLALASSEYQVS